MRFKDQPGERDLLDDLARPGCPVCRGSAQSARRLLEALLHESTDDGWTRARLRSANGFCADHALLTVQLSGVDGHGVAIIYADVLADLRRRATAAASGRRSWRARWRARRGGTAGEDPADPLAPEQPCLVCEVTGRRAATALSLLADAAPDSRLGAAARQEDRGLCVPHLRRGLALCGATGRQRLLEIFEVGADRLATDLGEYQRKLDQRFRSEPRGREQGSWRRAVLRVVGLPHHHVGLGPGGRDEHR